MLRLTHTDFWTDLKGIEGLDGLEFKAALRAKVLARPRLEVYYVVGAHLDSGKDGVVSRCSWGSSTLPGPVGALAVKVQTEEKALKEISGFILAGRHRHVLGVVDVLPFTPGHIAIVMPYAAYNSLVEFFGLEYCIRHYIGGGGAVQPATEAAAWMPAALVTQQALMAVRHLHARGVAHCDIKPDNILALGVTLCPPSHLLAEEVGVGQTGGEGLLLCEAPPPTLCGAMHGGAVDIPLAGVPLAPEYHETFRQLYARARATRATPAAGDADCAPTRRLSQRVEEAPIVIPRIALADFGRAVAPPPHPTSGQPGKLLVRKGIPGTAQYAAPELYALFPSDEGVDMGASDVWSLGITLAIFIFGGLPVDSRYLREGSAAVREAALLAVSHAISAWSDPFVMSAPLHLVEAAVGAGEVDGGYAMAARAAWGRYVNEARRSASGLAFRCVPTDTDVPAGLVDLVLRRMLVANPAHRWTAEQCLEHPWLRRWMARLSPPPTHPHPPAPISRVASYDSTVSSLGLGNLSLSRGSPSPNPLTHALSYSAPHAGTKRPRGAAPSPPPSEVKEGAKTSGSDSSSAAKRAKSELHHHHHHHGGGSDDGLVHVSATATASSDTLDTLGAGAIDRSLDHTPPPAGEH